MQLTLTLLIGLAAFCQLDDYVIATNTTTPLPNTTPAPGNGTANPPINGTAHPNNATGNPINGTANPINGTGNPINGTANPLNGTANPINGTGSPNNGTGNSAPQDPQCSDPNKPRYCNNMKTCLSILAHHVLRDICDINIMITLSTTADCPANQMYCVATKSCLSSNDANSRTDCGMTPVIDHMNNDPNSNMSCPNNMTFCESQNRCMNNTEMASSNGTCHHKNETEFNSTACSAQGRIFCERNQTCFPENTTTTPSDLAGCRPVVNCTDHNRRPCPLNKTCVSKADFEANAMSCIPQCSASEIYCVGLQKCVSQSESARNPYCRYLSCSGDNEIYCPLNNTCVNSSNALNLCPVNCGDIGLVSCPNYNGCLSSSHSNLEFLCSNPIIGSSCAANSSNVSTTVSPSNSTNNSSGQHKECPLLQSCVSSQMASFLGKLCDIGENISCASNQIRCPAPTDGKTCRTSSSLNTDYSIATTCFADSSYLAHQRNCGNSEVACPYLGSLCATSQYNITSRLCSAIEVPTTSMPETTMHLSSLTTGAPTTPTTSPVPTCPPGEVPCNKTDGICVPLSLCMALQTTPAPEATEPPRICLRREQLLPIQIVQDFEKHYTIASIFNAESYKTESQGCAGNTSNIISVAPGEALRANISNLRSRFGTFYIDQTPVTEQTLITFNSRSCLTYKLAYSNVSVADIPQFNASVYSMFGKLLCNYSFALHLMPILQMPKLSAKGLLQLNTTSEAASTPIPIASLINIEKQELPPRAFCQYNASFTQHSTDPIRMFCVSYLEALAPVINAQGIQLRFSEPPSSRDAIPGRMMIANRGYTKILEMNANGNLLSDLNATISFLPEASSSVRSVDFIVRGWNGIPITYTFDQFGRPKMNSFASYIAPESLTLTVKVAKVNSAPKLHPAAMASFLVGNEEDELRRRLKKYNFIFPYDDRADAALSTTAATLAKLIFIDDSDQPLGVVVYQAQNSSIGHFQYRQNASDGWQDLNVQSNEATMGFFDLAGRVAPTSDFGALMATTAERIPGQTAAKVNMESLLEARPSTPIQAMMLGPGVEVRFLLNNASTLWDNYEAQMYTNFIFTAWDYHDEPGMYGNSTNVTTITIDPNSCYIAQNKSCGWTTSIGGVYVRGSLTRLGCDGFPGSKLRTDRCNRCGGDGMSCVDCHGTVSGSAEYDMCGICSGGATGLTPDANIDCMGICFGPHVISTNFTGLCFNPQFSTDYELMNQAFCDGVFNSTAFLNECGYCVSGSTGKAKLFGVGSCGCNDNVTCLDCSGTAFGSKVRDPCGQCLLPGAASWGTTCEEMHDLSQKQVSAQGSEIVTVYGSPINTEILDMRIHLTSKSSATAYSFPMATWARANGEFAFSTSAMQAGEYRVNVTYTKNGVAQVKPMNVALTVYAEATYESIIPSSMVLSSTNVTSANITGTGFVNSTGLTCLGYCDRLGNHPRCGRRTRFLELPATYVSSTVVTCNLTLLSQCPRAIKWNLQVVPRLPKNWYDYIDLIAKSTVRFSITVAAPSLIRVEDAGRALSFVFDRGVESTGYEDCNSIFNSTALSKFGYGPVCFFRGSRIVVLKGWEASVCVGDYMVTKKVLRRRFADPELAEVSAVGGVVTSKTTFTKPRVFLRAMRRVDACSEIYLRADSVGAARKIFSWTVSCASGASCNASDVSELQAVLTNTTDFYEGQVISPGATVNISVTVTDECGRSSDPDTLTIQRMTDQKPITMRIRAPSRKVRADRGFKASIKIQSSKCFNSKISGVKFEWAITGGPGAVDMDFSRVVGPYLRVPPGKLKGDSTYFITAYATANGRNRIAQSTIPLRTASLPLRAYFEGGRKIVVGVSQTPELQLQVSDPNLADGTFTYSYGLTRKVKSGANTVYVRDTATGQRQTAYQYFQSQGSLTANVPWPTGRLQADTYILTATVKKGPRRVNATKEIIVKTGTPPWAKVITPSTINANEPLVIQGMVYNPTYNPVSASWSLISDDGNGYISLETCSKSELFKVIAWQGWTLSILEIWPSSACVFTNSQSYIFQYFVTSKDGEAYAEGEVSINSAPTAGNLTVSPVSGLALNTSFTLSVSDFSDDDDTELSYFYSCCDTSDLQNCFEVSPESTTATSMASELPAGTYRCQVEAFDAVGSATVVYASKNVTVSEKQLTLNDLTTLEDKLETVDEPLALGNMLLKAAISSGSNDTSTNSTRTKTINLVKKCIQQDVGKLDFNDATAACSRAAKSASLVVAANSTEDSMLNTLMTSTGTSCFAGLAPSASNSSSSNRRRRRRSASSSSSSSSTSFTVAQVESMLAIRDAEFVGRNEATYTKAESATFTTEMDTLITGLCNGLTALQQPVTATSKLAIIRAYKPSFQYIGNQTVDIGCSSTDTACLSKMTGTQTVVLGNNIASSYYNWSCGSSTCFKEGACIGTAQLSLDVFTPQATVAQPTTSTRRSNIGFFYIRHPTTGADQGVTSDSTGIPFSIPVTSDIDFSNASLLCRRWDGTDWTENNCTTGLPFLVNGTYRAVCTCKILGFVALFEGPVGLSPTTTEAPNTTVTTVTTQASATTIASNAYSIQLSFKFDANYTILVGNNKTQFIAHIKPQLASKMGILETQISSIDVAAGSIVVTMTVVSNPSGVSAAAAVQALKNLVTSGGLNITDTSGNLLTVLTNSFTFSILSYQTTQITTTISSTGVTNAATTRAIAAAAHSPTLYIVLGVVIPVIVIGSIILALYLLKCACFAEEKGHDANQIAPHSMGDQDRVERQPIVRSPAVDEPVPHESLPLNERPNTGRPSLNPIVPPRPNNALSPLPVTVPAPHDVRSPEEAAALEELERHRLPGSPEPSDVEAVGDASPRSRPTTGNRGLLSTGHQ